MFFFFFSTSINQKGQATNPDPGNQFPDILEQYLRTIAKTGDTM